MNKRKLEIIFGCLLHDIGKLLYRYHDQRNHSLAGYEWLKDLGWDNEDVYKRQPCACLCS